MVKSIYVIKNTINDKVYVGQAINPHRRFVQHLCNGNRSLDNLPIHLAIKKYGKQNFYYEILEENIENYKENFLNVLDTLEEYNMSLLFFIFLYK